MARRSPMNARYQKNTGPAGKTRRSASAAKPKREAGGQAPAPAKKKSSFREAMRQPVPTSPEIKRWRLVSVSLLIAAVVIVSVTYFVPALRANRTVVTVGFVLYAALLGGAMYIDFGIVRRLRGEAAADAKKSK